MIVLDANALVLLVAPEGAMPHIDRGAERIRRFVDDVVRRGETLAVPTPALAEVVAGGADRLAAVIAEISKTRHFQIVPFDTVAAVEAGERIRGRLAAGDPSERGPNWKHAMKYDAQIAAIAIRRNARAVLTDDRGIVACLVGAEVSVLDLTGLPLPEQGELGI